jgi:hypothetical protein
MVATAQFSPGRYDARRPSDGRTSPCRPTPGGTVATIVTTDQREDPVLLAADYPFLDIFWTMLVFFLWIMWFWLLIVILTDVFRRRDISGWGKAAWVLFVIVLPFLGVLVYLGFQGHGMSERAQQDQRVAREQTDEYIRSVATTDPAEQIAKAKQLLDSGAITQSEFDALKQKALAT